MPYLGLSGFFTYDPLLAARPRGKQKFLSECVPHEREVQFRHVEIILAQKPKNMYKHAFIHANSLPYKEGVGIFQGWSCARPRKLVSGLANDRVLVARPLWHMPRVPPRRFMNSWQAKFWWEKHGQDLIQATFTPT